MLRVGEEGEGELVLVLELDVGGLVVWADAEDHGSPVPELGVFVAKRAGAVVLGVSPDDEASHVKFKEKYDLPFTLLADTDHATAEEYGVWVEKKNYGKTYMGIERSTFIIDEDGNVARIMRRVDPETHADAVLAALE